MDPLRAAPGAEIVLAAVAGEDGVHVVGGAVRDALRGVVPRELDLVVEGDAIAVARRVAARIGGSLTVHERFGTATVRVDSFSFDLAGARIETYARPGALPDVRLGATIEQDLARRDFTINAIAVRLSDGAITAWPGAREDLDAGVLRVLHDRSFIDDPTRMLRLARYAARLDFAPDEHTAALIDPALCASVSGERLGSELRLALREPVAALRELDRRGLGRALLGEGFAAGWLAERAGGWAAERSGGGAAGRSGGGAAERSGGGAAERSGGGAAERGVLALAACCVAIDAATLAARLADLGFPAHERDTIVAAADGYARLHGRLAATDGALWAQLRRERVETIRLLAAAGEPGAIRWLDTIRHRKLAISGDDLVAAGLKGPQVGEALARATVAMLDGRAPDRASQLAAALAA